MIVTAPAYGQDVAGEWRPWRVLRGMDDVEMMLCDLPPGVRAIYAQRGEDRAILIDRNLPPAERLAALAHELVHLERGGGCHRSGMPSPLTAGVRREERRVDAEVARRLVPLSTLVAFIEMRLACEEPVTAEAVAAEFEVSEQVATDAILLLQRELRRLAG